MMNINHLNHSNHYLMNMNKDLIYNHPFFPLLTIMFDKCELATNSLNSLGSINEDIIEFTKQLNKEQSQCYTSNSEIDNLMIQAIQILRIHSLEIEKVHELCDNFCQKYINLLKGKMPMDILTDDSKSEEEESIISNDDDIKQSMCLLPIQTQHILPQISLKDEINENFDSDTYEENDDLPQRRQKKRGIFPKSATLLMRAWLFQHLNHPYPSEEQKKIFARETNLNILQVNNWFINARRRIVQPMIDQSNRAAMMGTVYNDFLPTNPYHTIDPSQKTYEFQTNIYDEIARTSAYRSPPITNYTSMQSNSFFTAVTDPSNTLLSTQYGISPSSYHRQESVD
ncbi:unnamed protein product [Rotaria sp. Silwood1]|nr:unnamed protein product [Rotaria sp. Silwood1]CAF4570690.1 unnamed protein product [Rotaria sp. Silwood1]CAF4767250.1 unnamed protein product [Rotaria sp. Silwood1]